MRVVLAVSRTRVVVRAPRFDVIDTRPRRLVALMKEATMVDDGQLIDGKQWTTKTARQTSKFLIEYYGDDNDRLTWLLAKFVAEAVYEQRPNDLIYWACVFSRCKGATLDEKAARELMFLREQSNSQGH
jgi:hypothetical protein